MAGVLSALGIAGVVLHRRRGRAATAGAAPERRSGEPLRSVALVLVVVALGTVTTLALGGIAVVDRVGRGTILTVLDVGQGDAVLLESRSGSRLLVDGGPDPDRLLVALDERIPAWDRRIDLVVLSHPHEDHVAGLATLLARYDVGRVLEPGMRGPGPGWQAWDETCVRADRVAGRSRPAAGCASTRSLDVLWPDPGEVPREPPDTGTGIGNVSVVLLGEVDGRRFLLAGDIEGVDPVLLARGLPRVHVLKVAHHGSATASSDPFLDAVRPRIAVASAGTGNRYGHPAPSTIGRLAAHGARVLRTDRDGSVELRFDAGRIRWRPRDRGMGAADRAGADPGGDRATAAVRMRDPVTRTAIAVVRPARGTGTGTGDPCAVVGPRARSGGDRRVPSAG